MKFARRICHLPVRYIADHVDEFVEAIERRGVLRGIVARNVFAFADGTFRPVARPSIGGYNGPHQRRVYNGQHGEHGLKYMGLVLPSGLLFTAGPATGAVNDARLFEMTGWRAALGSDRRLSGRFIYTDKGFNSDQTLLTAAVRTAPVRRRGRRWRRGAESNLSQHDAALNLSMSRVRVSVEWAFCWACSGT